ncbi:molybdopterin converting factor small subunit [Natronospira proteinivora]|uniref:Molybdopterin converting factor small subunit n=1 Tax=Natronospira proteinivora TaxID=1807133 RepID=A0ABT1G7K6_9GAMM|nr:MoaD/ThiS family protein [Natronospira proteinivora]MCP1727281.1 molybdopterin converting factor small subunit [Natronospira proteinivora]
MTRKIDVKLYGAFRQYSPNKSVTVSLPAEATVSSLRQAFAEQFDDDNARALLKASAFATDEAVLDEQEPVPSDKPLSILPPVCGG